MTIFLLAQILLSISIICTQRSDWSILSMPSILLQQHQNESDVPPNGGFARLRAQDLLYLQLDKDRDAATFSTKTLSLWAGSFSNGWMGVLLADRLEKAERKRISAEWTPLSEDDFASVYMQICKEVTTSGMCPSLKQETVHSHRMLLHEAASHLFPQENDIRSPTEVILLMFLAMYNNGWSEPPSITAPASNSGVKSYTITRSVHSSRVLDDLSHWLSRKAPDEQKKWFSNRLRDLHL